MGDSLSLNRDSSTIVSHRCRKFESALRDGSRPTIEGYLVDTEGQDRQQLVAALVAVEIQFRQQCGEKPRLTEYLERFPDYTEILSATIPFLLGEPGEKLLSTFIAQPLGTAVNATEEFTTQQQLGRYRLEAVLGRGGFGEVWRAFDPILHRTVAVKTLRRDRELSASALESFLNEGRHLAQLKHPGIVSIYDVGVEQGRAYIVSEFIDGTTLQKNLDERDYTWQEASLLVATIADALQKAHEGNIFHRDIKPSNILIDREGMPHVADFGLAVTEQEQMFESASTLGTFGYMPPEQVGGQSQHADGRADIYSLGVVLYRMLTDRMPFIAKTVEQYRTQVLQRAPRPLRQIIPTLPEELERACLKCLAKAPESRFYTASDLASELRKIVAEHQPPPVTPTKPLPPSSLNNWWPIAVMGLLIAAAAIAIPRLRGTPDDGSADRQGFADLTIVPDGGGDVVPVDPAALMVSTVEVAPPEQDSAVTWDIMRDGGVIRVTSSTPGLVQLGEYAGGRLSFDVEVEPIGALFAGLFLGHQTYGDDNEQVRYVVVEIQQWQQPGQQLVVHMPHYPILDESQRGDDWVGNRQAPLGPLETSKTIGVTIEEGRLTEVRLNGEPVEGILDRWDELMPPGVDCYGSFGLTCTLGAASFRDPLLNEVQAHFSVGRGSEEAEDNDMDAP